MPDLLDAIEIETGPKPEASVVWLHGLGADGHDFEAIVPELDLPDCAIRFVFPHAPMQPVSINAGMVMRAWYDIADPTLRRDDEVGVRASQARVEALLAREKQRGTQANRLVLAGFSQGGVIALQTGLRHPERLAGIMALSCYVPLAETLPDEANAANRDVPILMAHGTADPIVPFARATRSRDLLKHLGYDVQWHDYIMQHAVCAQEINDISGWLVRVLG